LDFKKIKQKERDNAKLLFKTREGKTQLKDIQRKAKTFVPGAPLPEATNKNTNAAGLTPEQVTFWLLAFLCALIVNEDCLPYKSLPSCMVRYKEDSKLRYSLFGPVIHT
jgi:hypothetical protein